MMISPSNDVLDAQKKINGILLPLSISFGIGRVLMDLILLVSNAK
jgi:hypothetical protein